MNNKAFHISVLTLFLACTATLSNAQFFGAKPTFWKKSRHSVGFGLGMSNFLGELGGRDQVGSDFVFDLEWSETRPALQAMYRYQVTQSVFAKAQFAFAMVGGDDALTEEIFRKNRNLHFRSTLFEFSVQGEVVLLDMIPDKRYALDVGRAGIQSTRIYATAGVGMVRYNPRAEFDGNWYELRGMHTEGQGLENGPEEYSLYSVVLPIGLGVRWKITDEWTLGLELVHRITFTDYIDDVSTVYYSNDRIGEAGGELAAYFADPSLGYYIDENGKKAPLNSTYTGAQRGDPSDNDSYMFGTLNAYYVFQPARARKGGGTKRRSRKVRIKF